MPDTRPQSDYPVVLGQPFTVDGVTYSPADTLNYDVVGHATAGPDGGDAISASHRTLPLPSYAEVTALDTGRTILVRIDRRGPMTGSFLTQLSPGAAAQLGITGRNSTPVRVRRVNPPEPERAALRSGRAATARMDLPPGLRAVLLRRLDQQGPGTQVSRPGPMPVPDKQPSGDIPRQPEPAAVAVPQPKPKPEPKPVTAVPVAHASAKERWVVQVAAFSTAERAQAAAAALGATVTPAGKLWRVRMTGSGGPADAKAALAKARAAGYTDARIQRAD